MRLVHLFRRPVPIRLRGRNWLALPLRLLDLAAMEAVAVSMEPMPAIPEGDIDDPDYREQLRALRKAYGDEAPEWGDDNCQAFVFGTTGGRAMVLQAVLREHELDDAEALGLAESLTPEEWQHVNRVAWGTDPVVGLLRYVDRLIGVPEQNTDGVPIAVAVCETAASLGVVPNDLAGMTLPEFRLIRAGGDMDNLSEYSDADVDGWRFYEQEVAPRRAAFWHGAASANGD